jgi:hypothetical protein
MNDGWAALTTILTRNLLTPWNPHKQGLANAKPHKQWLARQIAAETRIPPWAAYKGCFAILRVFWPHKKSFKINDLRFSARAKSGNR